MRDGLGDERERGEVQRTVEALGNGVAHGGGVAQVDLEQARPGEPVEILHGREVIAAIGTLPQGQRDVVAAVEGVSS